MNNDRRLMLHNALTSLDTALEIINEAMNEEQDCLDHFPENLLCSDRCSEMEDNISNMEDAIEKIEEAKESIDFLL